MGKEYKSIRNDQNGIVAIMVTMIIMVVMTLIVTGFIQFAGREQREALDRQLNTQATYAAESGINDAIRALGNPAFTRDKSTCGPITDGTVPELSKNELGDNISYSCLLIKRTVVEPRFPNVTTTKSTVFKISTIDTATNTPVVMDKYILKWKSKDGSLDLSDAYPELPNVSTWGSNKVPILRLDIIPADGVLSASGVQNSTYTRFFYPTSDSTATSTSYSTNLDNQGSIVPVYCTAGECKITIESMPAVINYYMRIKAVYNDADVSMCARACDGSYEAKDAQVEIDSTGNAGGILKRIKVRTPGEPGLGKTRGLRDFVFESQDDVCKLDEVLPNDVTTTCP